MAHQPGAVAVDTVAGGWGRVGAREGGGRVGTGVVRGGTGDG